MFYDRNLQLCSVIYDLNNSDLYYKTTILANLDMAMRVNYDCRIVIYDSKECSI
jgi:hypothetical protein